MERLPCPSANFAIEPEKLKHTRKTLRRNYLHYNQKKLNLSESQEKQKQQSHVFVKLTIFNDANL